MGVVLHLVVLAANMDPPMDSPVKTSDYVVSDPYTAVTLILGFLSLGYQADTGTTPTIPGHSLVYLDNAIDQPTFTSFLVRLGRQAWHAFGSACCLSQTPIKQSLPPLLPFFASLIL